MRIALLGPPGAGKGTQAKILNEHFGLDTISTGNLIRTAIREGSDLGDRVKSFVHMGNLVPDELVRNLANESIAKHKFDRFILDGYPRTVTQAHWVQEFLAAYKAPLDAVISLSLPDSVIVDRLSKRRIHKLTCESYHLEYHPPPADVDPTMIIRRKDDAPEAVRSRIETYREQTHPVEEFFRREGILIEVSGVGSVQDIGNRVLKQVEQFAELAIA
ncbi:MAG: adenylate kinase [Bacteroidetes Order II. Incertae sedis bacterium]|nr:adenylate kinase [Bacteroidetes Order II. bacterium]